jgi:hypothetical protein
MNQTMQTILDEYGIGYLGCMQHSINPDFDCVDCIQSITEQQKKEENRNRFSSEIIK